MVMLFCAFVGVAGSAFWVRVDEGDKPKSVGHLKKAIKKENSKKVKCNANDLQLFLAKTVDDKWLESDSEDAKKLEKGEKTVAVEALTSEEKELEVEFGLQRVLKGMPKPSTGQIHVLVVIDWENLSVREYTRADLSSTLQWREPRRLCSSSGKDWPYQGASELVAVLTDPLLDHYKAWEAGNEDKQNHAINLVLSGPGTGKSRMLDEMKDLLCQAAVRSKNQELVKKMKSAYTFHVTFENGTGSNGSLLLSDEVPEYDVSYRMLYQLTKERGNWTVFHYKLKRSYGHLLLTIATVVDMLAELTMTNVEDLTVILCVDGLQRFVDEGTKHCGCHRILSAICSFMNASKAFVVCACSATVQLPVEKALADSPQRHVLLVPPVLQGDQIWKPRTRLEKQLMDDMGGHGRALEALDAVLQKYAREELEEVEPTGIVKQVWIELKNRCGDLLGNEFYHSPSNVRELLAAILSRRRYHSSSRFGTGSTSRTVDELRSFGLFRLTGEGHLECAFILFYHLMMEISEKLPGVDDNFRDYFTNFALSWQRFENFMAFHRRLLSIAYSGIEVKLSAFHDGARFGPIDDIYIEEPDSPRVVVEAVNQHATKSSANDVKVLTNLRGELDISETETIIINGTSASTADVFSQVQLIIDKRQVQCNEVIQCKLLQSKQKMTNATYIEEMHKAVDENLGVFLLITPAEATEFPLPPRCGIVSKGEIDDYFGPFASRAHRSLFDRPNINIASYHALCRVDGVGHATAKRIIKEREERRFSSVEDAIQRLFPSGNTRGENSLRAMQYDDVGADS